MRRQAKIIATIGASCHTYDQIKAVAECGADGFRINERNVKFHSLNADDVVSNIRLVAQQLKRPLPIILNLREGDLKIGVREAEPLILKKGQQVYITTNQTPITGHKTLFCRSKNLTQIASVGDLIYVDYGKVTLRILGFQHPVQRLRSSSFRLRPKEERKDKTTAAVELKIARRAIRARSQQAQESSLLYVPSPERFRGNSASPPQAKPSVSFRKIRRVASRPVVTATNEGTSADKLVLCEVLNDYIWHSHLPCRLFKRDGRFHISEKLIEKERKMVQWARRLRIEYVVIKYFNDEDQEKVYRMFDRSYPRLIIGIITKRAVENIDRLLNDRVYAIFYGRGWLGLEIGMAQVTTQQKIIAEKCSRVGKPFIISTQMLETMTLNPIPSSAEVADVTNAILDGADCICLAGETGTGLFPLESITTCDRIILEAEMHQLRTKSMSTLDVYRRDRNTLGTLAYGAVQYVLAKKAKLICLQTRTGLSAMQLRKFKPPCAVLVVTDNEVVMNQLQIFRGMHGFYVGTVLSTEPAMHRLIEHGKTAGLLVPGDEVVCISGNNFELHREKSGYLAIITVE